VVDRAGGAWRSSGGGQLVHVRFIWSDTTTDSPHWQQAFSVDDGATWWPNWEVDLTWLAK
jgi:hypothetical protein